MVGNGDVCFVPKDTEELADKDLPGDDAFAGDLLDGGKVLGRDLACVVTHDGEVFGSGHGGELWDVVAVGGEGGAEAVLPAVVGGVVFDIFLGHPKGFGIAIGPGGFYFGGFFAAGGAAWVEAEEGEERGFFVGGGVAHGGLVIDDLRLPIGKIRWMARSDGMFVRVRLPLAVVPNGNGPWFHRPTIH